jgi:UDP-N-acetylglucosamine acyltransferase
MKNIHPTAVIGPEVQLADDVQIGPGCQFDGPITIGPGCSFQGFNFLRGPLTMGANNRIYPFACFGLEPQDFKFDPTKPGAGTVIGNDNIFREYFTIHRATSDEKPTRVGSNGMFMVSSHIGHDCTVGDRCVFANSAMIGGHTVVYDQVNCGGNSGIAQNLALGKLAFISGGIALTMNLPPYMICRGRNTCGGVNIIGLRRSGMPREEIDRVKWAFRVLFMDRNSRPTVRAAIAQEAPGSAALTTILDYLDTHKGAIAAYERALENKVLHD